MTWRAHVEDPLCYCCGRRQSRIDHPRVWRQGPEVTKAIRRLMSWIPR